jgi:dephospho-CoA kinase
MLVIGLTGGILSGKSTVAQFLSQLGAVVIDADELGHEIYKPHAEAWQEIVTTFGNEVLTENGEVDRQKLSQIVFSSPKALRQLNQITHPKILSIAQGRLEELRRQGAEVVILEASLLIEANWIEFVDQVWVTIAPESTVLQRLRHRSGFSEEQARARIRSQMPTEEMLKYADAVINTDCDLEQVRARVERLWQGLKSPKQREACL